RPGGSPATANAPALSLTPNALAPRTATITPGMGRPLVDDRAVPTIRAVVSRWTCPGKRETPTHRMSRLLSGTRFTRRNLLRKKCWRSGRGEGQVPRTLPNRCAPDCAADEGPQ